MTAPPTPVSPAAAAPGSALPSLPNPLFANGRSVLARFGYQAGPEGAARDDWAAMWDLLRGDFAPRNGRPVPAYDALPPAVQEAARAYMAQRLIADRNLETCERWHVALFSDGVQTDAVEAYAVARDAYEDSVEAFGAARDRLDLVLQAPGET